MASIINGAWNGTATVAGQLQRVGNWVWQKVPSSERIDLAQIWRERTQQADAEGISNPAIKACGSIIFGKGTGLVTEAALGVLFPATVASGVGTVAMVGMALATLMASYPNRTVVLKIPNGPLVTLRTPGEQLPDTPEKILPNIKTKISQFKTEQPAGMFWEKPIPAPIHVPQSATLLSAREITNAKADILVKNGSVYATLCSIHSGENTEDVHSKFLRIVQEASGMAKVNLWKLYVKHFPNLTFFQKVKARFWYFFFHNLGIIPNSIASFRTNLLNAFRKNVEEGKSDKLNVAVEKVLKLASSFLGILNKATEDFANGNPPLRGTLAEYQEQAITQLGDPDILAKVKARLKPGENLGEKMMEELCKRFTLTLLDEFFPRVPFFAKLKQFRLLGLRIGVVFDALDWAFGGIINAILRNMLKGFLPNKVNRLVRLGIEKTLPGQYPFKIALANTLTNQMEELKRVLARNGRPARLVKNDNLSGAIDKLLKTLELKKLGSDPLPEAVRSKLEDLETNKDQQLRDRMRDVQIEGGQHVIRYYTQNPENIEKMFADLCELSNKPFQPGAEVQNEEAYLAAKARMRKAAHSLVEEQIKHTVLRGEIKGPDPKKFKAELIDGIRDQHNRIIHKGLFPEQKEKAIASFGALKVVTQSIYPEPFKHLDHAVEILNEFVHQAEKLNIDLYNASVRDTFYGTFAPIYQEALQLMDQLLELQKLQKENQLVQFQENLAAFNAQLDLLLTKVRNLEEPQIHFPQQHVPEPVLNLTIKYVGEPIIKKIQEYFDSAYNLINSSHIYEATARLGMGELIRTYKK